MMARTKKTTAIPSVEDSTEVPVSPETVEEAIAFDIADLEGVGAVRKKRLEEAGITDPMALVVKGPTEIAEITGLDLDQAEKISRTAREYLQNGNYIKKSFQSARQTMEHRRDDIDKNRISLGCKSLDELLGGGLEPQSITEFYGLYGCGKTQVCLTSAVMAQLPKDQGGLNGKVIWIDTEGTFRPERIEEIVIERGLVPLKEKLKKTDKNEPVDYEDVYKFLDNIEVATAYNASHQELILDEIRAKLEMQKLGTTNEEKRVVLVIVDSLTTHYRVEFVGRGLLAPRQGKINNHIHGLKNIAKVYGIAVIVTNQVMASPQGFGDPIKPVGGNVLAHASTYRIYIKKSSKNKRVAKFDDSPMHDQTEVVFALTAKGVAENED